MAGCSEQKDKNGAPLVAFLDYVQDPTIEKAYEGFMDALQENGFSEPEGTIELLYSNAQGDIPTLNQACDMMISRKPHMMATNVTLPTITAARKTNEVPIFMMVAPRPDIAGLTDKDGRHQDNLFGVYETLAYIDTAIVIIKELVPEVSTIGVIYNQSEPQSVDAYNVLEAACEREGVNLIRRTVLNSSESQLVTRSLLEEEIDVFFALPDNVIFASFEVILSSCDDAGVPVFTSEAGLVERGAVASYGADFYMWGYQAGEQAAAFLKGDIPDGPEEVKVRTRIFNAESAARFGIEPGPGFTPSGE
jgi:putative ABC transport system substrate-binding protein